MAWKVGAGGGVATNNKHPKQIADPKPLARGTVVVRQQALVPLFVVVVFAEDYGVPPDFVWPGYRARNLVKVPPHITRPLAPFS